MRHHPNPRGEIPISKELSSKLLEASFATGLEKETWEIAETAINEWVVRNNPDSIALPAVAGYQWKRVFLPNGTLLRTVFNGKNHHCIVEEDSLRFNGQATSPSRFVNAVGGIRRNAWKAVWILFPGTQRWVLAETLRRHT